MDYIKRMCAAAASIPRDGKRRTRDEVINEAASLAGLNPEGVVSEIQAEVILACYQGRNFRCAVEAAHRAR